MKIVKFKNGKYGVRKWAWIGWVFATNKSGDWEEKSDRMVQEFKTLEYAEEVYRDMESRKDKPNDYGKVLDT